MRRKISFAIAAAVLTAAISFPAALAAQNSNPLKATGAPEVKQQINLTEAQKKELKELWEKSYELKRQMVKKYLEFGIITKEQADKRLKRLDEMQKKIQENGYLPMYRKGHKGQDKDKKQQDSNN